MFGEKIHLAPRPGSAALRAVERALARNLRLVCREWWRRSGRLRAAPRPHWRRVAGADHLLSFCCGARAGPPHQGLSLLQDDRPQLPAAPLQGQPVVVSDTPPPVC